MAVALLVAACGDGGGEGSGQTEPKADATEGEDLALGTGDVGTQDAGGDDDAGAQPETAGDAGGLEPEISGPSCPGEAGCTCLSAINCDSNFCIDTPKGKLCAKTCVEDCPEDFKCTTVPGPGGDSQNICVPRWGKRCDPCNENADCKTAGNGDAVCLDLGATGRFCGSACGSDGDCGPGYACEEAADVTGQKSKQCVIKGGGVCPCSPAAIASELSTECWVTAGDAKCAGKRTCLADGKDNAPPGGGLSACLAPKPAPEVCDGVDNDCDGQSDEQTCDDNNPCTADSCGGPAGCKHQNKQGSCDADGSACTEGDACADGNCAPGTLLDCNDGNVCTTDLCKPESGCAFEPKSNAPCNADDSPCTVADACDEGVCKPGTPKQCATTDFCVLGKCDLVTGKCKFAYKSGTPCNDGNACTNDDTCVDDICKGKKLSCDDSNVCTAESCDPLKGCSYSQLGGPCDDGDACTKGDACAAGKCVGLAVEVSQGCDDANPCTADTCDPKTGCVHAPGSGMKCEDGNPCTTSDLCKLGKCEPGTNKCTCKVDSDCKSMEDGNLCNGTLYCDKDAVPWSCKVNPATVIKCDGSLDSACKSNVCDPLKGLCAPDLKQNGTPCDADGSLCTVGDTCQGGKCVPGPVAKCDDANPCTNDACAPKKGCVSVPNSASCDADGDLCTLGDACKDGKCVVGTVKKDCDDSEPCTSETCVKSTGKCAYKKLQQSCDDGSACTKGDLCGADKGSGAWTCISGAVAKCDDGNVCTADACDPKKGCTHPLDTKTPHACYTGPAKTRGVGACKDGVRTCDLAGKLGPCKGETLPGPKELCSGVDDDCDGVTDEGCKPLGFEASFGAGAVQSKGGKHGVRALVGEASLGGRLAGSKTSARLGFAAWLRALIGGK